MAANLLTKGWIPNPPISIRVNCITALVAFSLWISVFFNSNLRQEINYLQYLKTHINDHLKQYHAKFNSYNSKIPVHQNLCKLPLNNCTTNIYSQSVTPVRFTFYTNVTGIRARILSVLYRNYICSALLLSKMGKFAIC